MIRWLVLLMFLTTPALASEVVCFDNVSGAVNFYSKSANTPDYSSNPDCLINPASTPNTDRIYWKRSGNDVLEMTQSEKDAVDQAIADEIDADTRSNAKSTFDGQTPLPLVLRAFASILKDEINILRSQHGLAPRNLAQLKTAIQNEVDSGNVDE